MYVWFRLLRVGASISRRGPYRLGEESRLSFVCLPTDIDTNLHLNNARYMMLADLGRIDIFQRLGLLSVARQRGWAPMLGGLQASFVREIRLWRRFDLFSSIETWSGTQAIGRHRFVLDSGETAAVIMTTAGIYDRQGRRFMEVAELLDILGQSTAARAPTAEETAFIGSHQALRSLAKQPK